MTTQHLGADFQKGFGRLGVIITSLVISTIAALAVGWYMQEKEISPLSGRIEKAEQGMSVLTGRMQEVEKHDKEQDDRITALEYNYQADFATAQIDFDKKLAEFNNKYASLETVDHLRDRVVEAKRIAGYANKRLNYWLNDMKADTDGVLSIKSDAAHLSYDTAGVITELDAKPIGTEAKSLPESSTVTTVDAAKGPAPAANETNSSEMKGGEGKQTDFLRRKKATVTEIIISSPPFNTNSATVSEPSSASSPPSSSATKTTATNGTGTGTGNPTTAPAPVVQPPPVQPPAGK